MKVELGLVDFLVSKETEWFYREKNIFEYTLFF